MRVIRSYIDQILRVGDTVVLPEQATAHLTRVLRLRAGDACVLFNGDGNDYAARLRDVGKHGAEVEILSMRIVDNESPLRITLLQGIARGEKMDLILQKATELGVHAFVPVHSERSEVKLDGERAAKRLAHWRGVVASACEQSGRARLPEVTTPLALQAATQALPAQAVTRLLLDPDATQSIHTLASASGALNDIVLAVGPEGGWSPRDRECLQATGFHGVRLGPRVLRTETAGLAAIAALQARYGDLQ